MLDDNIEGGARGIIHGAVAIARGAVRGALWGLGIALAVVAIGALFSNPVTATGMAFVTAKAGFAWAAVTGAFTGFTTGAGSAIAGMGIGAALLGVTSIIPGIGEWPGLFKKTVAVPGKVVNYADDVRREVVPPELTQKVDNYLYEEGKGARMKDRGDKAEAAVTRA